MVTSKVRTRIEFQSGTRGILLFLVFSFSLLLVTVPAFAAGGSCPTGANYINPADPTGPLVTLSSLGITSCFYFSKSGGSDNNTGTSESSPQAHLPGMPSYTGSITPAAGQGFILKGGDRWIASDMPLRFNGNGTSGSGVYVGFDLTWFVGASWTRPVFDCQSTQCGSNAQVQINQSYVTVDNIELTGLRFITKTQKGVEVRGASDVVERCYIHGWSHDPGWGGGQDDGRGFGMGSNGGTQATYRYNVVDGSDTSKDMMGGADDGEQVYNNVFKYVYNGVRGHHNDVHGNLIANLILDKGGDHANGISIFGPMSGSTNLWVYNNIIEDNSLSPGAEILWVMSLGNYPGSNTYLYNNVLYNVGRGIDVGDHPPNNGGTFWVYNNSINSGGGACVGNGETPPRNVVNFENNHCINTNKLCDASGVSCNDLGANLAQTNAQANANVSAHYDQYTTSETYVWSPLGSTNSTVGAGNNLTSACSGNVAALCNDTTYPTYDSVNHAVVMRTSKSRPASGAWDIGAFEYNGENPPQPPSGLTALVQ